MVELYLCQTASSFWNKLDITYSWPIGTIPGAAPVGPVLMGASGKRSLQTDEAPTLKDTTFWIGISGCSGPGLLLQVFESLEGGSGMLLAMEADSHYQDGCFWPWSDPGVEHPEASNHCILDRSVLDHHKSSPTLSI